MKTIVVENLSFQYQPDSDLVLNNINFHINQGEAAVITGLTGCGKSTLCLCISGAIRHKRDGVVTGEVMVNGKNIREISRGRLALEVGIVFQDPDTQLFLPTVEDEIAFAPENLCLEPDSIKTRINNVLELLGITALRDENPCNLSGGEKQLVALGAVLALDPPVLILDEVMSQLDIEGKKRVVSTLKNLRDKGKSIIMVEHDIQAVEFSDRLMVMEQGRIIRFDETDCFGRSAFWDRYET
jgi:energy-coupling factor transport system ATP-binding protein